jgi:hypothetical protein
MRLPIIDRYGFTIPRKKRHYQPYPNKRAIDHNYPNQEKKTSSLKYWLYFLASLISGGNILFMAAHALALVGVSFWLSCGIALATIFSTGIVFRNLYKDLRYDPEHRGQHITKLGLLLLGGYLLAHFAFIAIMALAPGANILIGMLYIAAATGLGIHLANFVCNTVLPYLFHQGKQFLRFLRKKPQTRVKIPKRDLETLDSKTELFQTQLHNNDTLSKLKALGLQGNAEGNKKSPEETNRTFSQKMQYRLACCLIAERQRNMTRNPLAPLTRRSKITRCNNALNQLLNGNSGPAMSFYLTRLDQHLSKLAQDAAAIHRVSRALWHFKNKQTETDKLQAIDELLRIIWGNHKTVNNTHCADKAPSIYFKLDTLGSAIRRIAAAKQKNTALYLNYLNKYLVLSKKHTDITQLLEELVAKVSKAINKRHMKKLEKLSLREGLSVEEIEASLEIKLRELQTSHPSFYAPLPTSQRNNSTSHPELNTKRNIQRIVMPLKNSLTNRSICIRP